MRTGMFSLSRKTFIWAVSCTRSPSLNGSIRRFERRIATSMEPVSSCSVKAAFPHFPPSPFWRERDRWTTPWSVTSSKLEESADERRLPIDTWPHASVVTTKSTASNPTRIGPMECCFLASSLADSHRQWCIRTSCYCNTKSCPLTPALLTTMVRLGGVTMHEVQEGEGDGNRGVLPQKAPA